MNYTYGKVNGASQRRLRSSARELRGARSQSGGFGSLAGLVKRPQNLGDTLAGKLLRYRWWLMLLLALSYSAFEIVEHSNSLHGFNLVFHSEFWLYAAVVPVLGGLTLSLLAQTESERFRAVGHLDLKHELSVQLSSSQTWDSLVDSLIKFPSRIAAFDEVSLLLYDEEQEEFRRVARWQDPEVDGPALLDSPWVVDACEIMPAGALQRLKPECFPDLALPDEGAVYGLPLMHGRLLVAMYLLYLPSPELLAEDSIDLLNSVAPSIALAVDALHPQGSRTVRAEATAAEQQRLSRYLHDTIAQNIGYLILRLEHLQDENTLHDPMAFQKEIDHLHGVANEAYEQTRKTMATLYPYNPGDLASLLSRWAELECDQDVELNIKYFTKGKTRQLSPYRQRKILAIFREALTNAKKHGHATELDVQLQWEERLLTMTVNDDGDGFCLAGIPVNGGYGLKVMEERAGEMGGQISLESQPGVGTEVILQVPLEAGS
jgi:signal transduction histidine kinase